MSQSLRELASETAETTALSENDRHRLLWKERRRLTIQILANRILPVDLEDLAAAVAARESDVNDPDEEVVERVAIDLHHVHLPVMSDLGLIDYDDGTHRIE